MFQPEEGHVFPCGHSIVAKEIKAIATELTSTFFSCHLLGLYSLHIKLDCHTALSFRVSGPGSLFPHQVIPFSSLKSNLGQGW